MVFTEKERFVLLFMISFAVIGIITGLVKNIWLVEPPIDVVIPVKTEMENNSSKIGVEIPAIVSSEIININIANKDELTSLPSVGPVTAERIIRFRDDFGPFKALEDLQKVKGIGPKTFEKIKLRISIN
ncbi:MAG: helix-hairpin-helix domain-containing protein [Candidatus Marinimicrobia bacterium]|nr:helix-hairpin-helix domain-containing protein [Candidatus Neomarinimicrobiota bacterium]